MPSLYLHIPFCETKCVYCDFYSVESGGVADSFVEALAREIRARAAAIESPGAFDTIFLGGGTPSLLTPGQLGRIAEAVRAHFPLAPGAEWSMECNPGTVDPPKLAAYRRIGVNRLSFGVQSFFDDDLRALSRIHTAAEAAEAVRAARDAGFGNVNIDLMFSLPQQTPERWMRNLERARTLGTTHISCYSLTVEEGTPLAAMRRKGEVVTATEESDAELFLLTMERLEAWGFRQYEISNYALEGFECRHNLAYWHQEDYLGFGPSAHSTWQGERSWNISSLGGWLDAVARTGDAHCGREELTPALLRKEHIFLRLRCSGIDIAEFRRRFGEDLRETHADRLRIWRGAGLLEESEERIRLTRKGRLLCDEICAELM